MPTPPASFRWWRRAFGAPVTGALSRRSSASARPNARVHASMGRDLQPPSKALRSPPAIPGLLFRLRQLHDVRRRVFERCERFALWRLDRIIELPRPCQSLANAIIVLITSHQGEPTSPDDQHAVPSEGPPASREFCEACFALKRCADCLASGYRHSVQLNQCNRNTPSTACSSAGLMSFECATVTANRGPSSDFSQNARKFFSAGKFGNIS
jgi:hypothetical protein